jgi:hypothetical protein
MKRPATSKMEFTSYKKALFRHEMVWPEDNYGQPDVTNTDTDN